MMKYYFYILFLLSNLADAQPNNNTKINDHSWNGKITATNQSKINSAATDFSPAYWNEYIVYSSSKKRQKIFDPTTNEGFFDLYFTDINSDDELEKSAQLSKVINTKFHDASASFTKDGLHIFLSRMDDNGYMNIFESDYKNGEWLTPRPASFNEKESENMHPSISYDGKTIFFSSNRDGGYGEMDLYYSKFEDGKWSKPINLGPNINTKNNELFPFISESNYLFFSSDKHDKNRDLDIYKLNIDSILVQKPIRLPEPLNTKFDDLGIICDFAGMTGYFSSNRPGGAGKDDIYKFSTTESIYGYGEAKYNVISIVVKEDHTDKPISNATIKYRHLEETETYLFNKTLFNIEDTPYDSLFTDDKGRAQIKLNSNFTLIEANAPFKEKWQVLVTDKLKSKTLDIHLSDNKLPEVKPEIKFEENQVFEINNASLTVGEVLVFDNIYYDYNSSDIQPGAALELDALTNEMIRNEKLKVQLRSHTDSRGEENFNLLLSEKRAISAKKYLMNKGINSNRISTIGYGEMQLRNHCKNGVVCSEEEHLYNRRTEVKILEN